MSAPAPPVVHLNARDHVAVALRDIAEGETVPSPQGPLIARAPIPSGHKIAVAPVDKGAAVLKYGWPLGAVQKAGAATLTQVLRYGEQARRPGLALLEAPGNDAVSSTALTAAGATVILFTTGRGTPLGFPAPTLKIASNSRLAEAKPRWIDFDAGRLLAGQTQDEAADALMDLVVETASGRPTRAELNGEREIAIWKTGVTL
jgi:hypothetical protein